jgi:predicted nuclease of predicted toxin-antitoxin system
MSVRFLADEDFDNDIVRGLLRRCPTLDIVRVQDVTLSGQPDPVILEWAAKEGRILLTHDVSTLTAHAIIQNGLPMPGVFAVSQDIPIGQAIEDLLLIAKCSLEGEWEGQVRYLPLR